MTRDGRLSRMPQLRLRLLGSGLLIGSTVILGACATTTDLGVTTEFEQTYCTIELPIYWSKRDTDQTISQAIGHNAVWSSMGCKPPEVVPAPPGTVAKALY